MGSRRRFGRSTALVVSVVMILSVCATAGIGGASVIPDQQAAGSLADANLSADNMSIEHTLSVTTNDRAGSAREPGINVNRNLTIENGSNYHFRVINDDTGNAVTLALNRSTTVTTDQSIGLLVHEGDGATRALPEIWVYPSEAGSTEAQVVGGGLRDTVGIANLTVALLDASTDDELARTESRPHLHGYNGTLTTTETAEGLRLSVDRDIAPQGANVSVRLDPTWSSEYGDTHRTTLSYDPAADAFTTVVETDAIEPGNYSWRASFDWQGAEIISVLSDETVALGDGTSSAIDINVDSPTSVTPGEETSVAVSSSNAAEIRVSGETGNWTIEETDPGTLTTFPAPSNTPYVVQPGETVGHIFASPGDHSFTLTLTAPNATGTYNFTGSAETSNATATEQFSIEVATGPHESGVSQPVFDAVAGSDDALSRSDILGTVESYLQSGAVDGVAITRSDVLTLVEYYLTQ